MIERAAHWPACMSTTGTHDTKRGEDLRARLNVLSEIPETWVAAVRHWQSLHAPLRSELDGAAVPDANEEYLIYQTLVGTWPLAELDAQARQSYTARIVQYLDKALREAKLHTSWLNPNVEYDQAVASFIRSILAEPDAPFVQSVQAFAASIADAGYVNSLAQTLVKIAAPGVPDFYQGVEFWDFNLVDPDNRRPTDFAARGAALEALQTRAGRTCRGSCATCSAVGRTSGSRCCSCGAHSIFAATRRTSFAAAYEPLVSDGPHGGQLLAFARGEFPHAALCIVPRLAYESWRTREGGAQSKLWRSCRAVASIALVARDAGGPAGRRAQPLAARHYRPRIRGGLASGRLVATGRRRDFPYISRGFADSRVTQTAS